MLSNQTFNSPVNNRRRSIPSLKDKQESMKMHKSVDLRLRQSAHINMSRQAGVPKNSTNMGSKPGGRGEHRYMPQSYLYRMQSVSPQMRSQGNIGKEDSPQRTGMPQSSGIFNTINSFNVSIVAVVVILDEVLLAQTNFDVCFFIVDSDVEEYEGDTTKVDVERELTIHR